MKKTEPINEEYKFKSATIKDLKELLHDLFKKLVTKKDIKDLVDGIELKVLKNIKEYSDLIKKYIHLINSKLTRIDTKISRNNLEIAKQQKFLLQKIKEHEKRIQKLEGEYWEN